MDAKIIGQHIREYRKTKSLSQRELAELLYVSDKTVSRWELGKGLPDIAELPHIAQMLGITIDELVGETSELASDNVTHDKTSAAPERRKVAPAIIGSALCFVLVAAAVIISLVSTGVFESYESTYIFEAEDALFTDSFVIEEVAHASGGKVAAWLHTEGESLTIRVMSNRMAKVSLGIVVNRAMSFVFEDKMRLTVNEKQVEVGVVPGLGWDGGADELYYKFGDPIEVDANLIKGENIITVTIVEGANLNIDCFWITTTARLTLMLQNYYFEAEDATISGLHSIISSDRASGGKYLGDLNVPGTTVGFCLLSDRDAYVIMEIYINRPYLTNFEKKFLTNVNGRTVTVGIKEGMGVKTDEDRQCSFSDPFTVGISLKKGENNIVFTVVNGANFDRIAFNTSLLLTGISAK